MSAGPEGHPIEPPPVLRVSADNPVTSGDEITSRTSDHPGTTSRGSTPEPLFTVALLGFSYQGSKRKRRRSPAGSFDGAEEHIAVAMGSYDGAEEPIAVAMGSYHGAEEPIAVAMGSYDGAEEPISVAMGSYHDIPTQVNIQMHISGSTEGTPATSDSDSSENDLRRRDRNLRWNYGKRGLATKQANPRATQLCDVPWGGTIQYFGRQGDTHLLLPQFTSFVGVARSVDDLDAVGSTIVPIPYNRKHVWIDGQETIGITHIAFRNRDAVQISSPRIVRRLVMVGGNSTWGQICESGPVLKKDVVAKGTPLHNYQQAISTYVQGLPEESKPSVLFYSATHRLATERELRLARIHPIPSTGDDAYLPGLLRRAQHDSGLEIRARILPFIIFAIGLGLWLTPGVIQWFGEGDHNWASVINQCIGTGSVLLGVVVYITRKMFSHASMRAAMGGWLYVKNDIAARVVARKLVSKLEGVACDPRMPGGLIATANNSCVRAGRHGWLRIGRKIPVRDASKHGYYILMNVGLALDLYEANLYKMITTHSGDERILRHGERDQWRLHVIRRDACLV